MENCSLEVVVESQGDSEPTIQTRTVLRVKETLLANIQGPQNMAPMQARTQGHPMKRS